MEEILDSPNMTYDSFLGIDQTNWLDDGTSLEEPMCDPIEYDINKVL